MRCSNRTEKRVELFSLWKISLIYSSVYSPKNKMNLPRTNKFYCEGEPYPLSSLQDPLQYTHTSCYF